MTTIKRITSKLNPLLKGQPKEKSPVWDLVNPENEINQWVVDDFFARRNIGTGLLFGFYCRYRKTLNEFFSQLNGPQKQSITESLKDIIKEHEYLFDTAIKHVMITEQVDLDKLNSAVKTSSVFLKIGQEDVREVEGLFQKICDAPEHLFERLEVYSLRAPWSIKIGKDRGELQWRFDGGEVFSLKRKPREGEPLTFKRALLPKAFS